MVVGYRTTEYVLPQVREPGGNRGGDGSICVVILLIEQCAQGGAIQLPGGGCRQGIDLHEHRWDELGDQHLAQGSANPVRRDWGFGRVEACESRFRRRIIDQDRGLDDPVDAMQGLLDLAELHAETPDLDLAVDAARERETTVGTQESQIAGAVHASHVFGIDVRVEEGILHELPGGEFLAVQVAHTDTCSSDADLAGQVGAARLAPAIQDVDPVIVQGGADGSVRH